jgi:hypothetical protein
VLPVWGLDPSFREVMSADFYLITLTTFLAPILCFILELARQPRVLFRFLCRSSTVYAALGPMSCLGVLSYLITGKAKFLVTGDRRGAATLDAAARSPIARLRAGARRFLWGSHPDHPVVQGFELLCGITFGATCVALLQISFLGLSLSFVLLPVLHHVSWEHPLMQRLIYVPFLLILTGISLGGLGVLGVQPIFFGYGFHF